MKVEAAKLEAEGITLAYGPTPVLRGITMTVEPGEFFALLGPSGCGKSTYLRVIAGFAQPQQGRLAVNGRDLLTIPPWQRNVGLVFQNYALWPHLSAFDNVAFGLVERRVPREQVRRRAGEALELVGLSALAGRRPHQLSGGQQQRVALARTLAVEPQLLLLDEPLSNLDAKLRVSVRAELKALQRRLGITAIFVTHDQEEALSLCDRVALLDHGVLQQVAAPRELYDRPANDFVARFVGSINLLPGRIVPDGATARFEGPGGARVAVPEGGPAGEVTLAFRPHAVGFAASTGSVELSGRVAEAEFLGEFVRYRVDTGGASISVDRLNLAREPLLAVGMPVSMYVPWAEVRVLR
jgi:iron(III) transport system ATP-binding protein